MDTKKRIELEKRMVRKLVRLMKKSGWMPYQVDDCCDVKVEAKTENDILETVFSVDQCWVGFKKERVFRVFLVLGNMPWEVVCDYTDSDTNLGLEFEAVMGELQNYGNKMEEEYSK